MIQPEAKGRQVPCILLEDRPCDGHEGGRKQGRLCVPCRDPGPLCDRARARQGGGAHDGFRRSREPRIGPLTCGLNSTRALGARALDCGGAGPGSVDPGRGRTPHHTDPVENDEGRISKRSNQGYSDKKQPFLSRREKRQETRERLL